MHSVRDNIAVQYRCAHCIGEGRSGALGLPLRPHCALDDSADWKKSECLTKSEPDLARTGATTRCFDLSAASGNALRPQRSGRSQH